MRTISQQKGYEQFVEKKQQWFLDFQKDVCSQELQWNSQVGSDVLTLAWEAVGKLPSPSSGGEQLLNYNCPASMQQLSKSQGLFAPMLNNSMSRNIHKGIE